MPVFRERFTINRYTGNGKRELDRLAALIPPPRNHHHRYYDVLAPNSPLRAAVIALAVPAPTLTPPAPPLSVCFLDFLQPLRVDRHVSNGSETVGSPYPATSSPVIGPRPHRAVERSAFKAVDQSLTKAGSGGE